MTTIVHYIIYSLLIYWQFCKGASHSWWNVCSGLRTANNKTAYNDALKKVFYTCKKSPCACMKCTHKKVSNIMVHEICYHGYPGLLYNFKYNYGYNELRKLDNEGSLNLKVCIISSMCNLNLYVSIFTTSSGKCHKLVCWRVQRAFTSPNNIPPSFFFFANMIYKLLPYWSKGTLVNEAHFDILRSA